MCCRFYANEFPQKGEKVIGKIIEIKNYGIEIVLLEYNNLLGLALFNELNCKKERSIKRIYKVGKIDCFSVLDIDSNKNIDLSNKILSIREKDVAFLAYLKAKKAHSIFYNLSLKSKLPINIIYENIGWALEKKFENSLTGLYRIYKDPVNAFKILSKELYFFKRNYNLSIGPILVNILKKKLPKFKLKVSSLIKIISDDINFIKDMVPIFNSIKNKKLDNSLIMINYVGAPIYKISIENDNINRAINFLDTIFKLIKQMTKISNGHIRYFKKPFIEAESKANKFFYKLKLI